MNELEFIQSECDIKYNKTKLKISFVWISSSFERINLFITKLKTFAEALNTCKDFA